ncbi:hypothetical protein J437_LFUL007630 [Ladona fulva]|uniref:ATP receptor n=1 Tax=Ladona fulva TaxID=123851 RepID=A0A8K0K6P2_LADFU|nr:hypothetical protein J437_LFUL007630 [Ladona fulva]
MFRYVIIYNKGYQECDRVESSVTTKVKGVTFTNFSKDEFQVPATHIPLYNRLWDVSEYVIPASENDAFFIMTNTIITPNQSFGTCDENPDVKGALCGVGLPPCKKGYVNRLGNGVTTGRCVNSTQNSEVQVCEVEAWCPVDDGIFPLKGSKPLLEDSQYYTVLIKNRIYFPKFGTKYLRSNLMVSKNLNRLQSCRYDKWKDPLCPIFLIKDVVESAGENFSEIAIKGAVIAIRIVWNCNLDLSFTRSCLPEYSFHRLDHADHNVTFGWNFRRAFHHEFGRRTLQKVYGIKFVIDVHGEGCKAAVIPTLSNLGLGCGFFVLAPLISDCIMRTCLKSKSAIKNFKYVTLKGDMPFLVDQPDYIPMEAEQTRSYV